MTEANEPVPPGRVPDPSNPYAPPESELRSAPAPVSGTNLVLASRWARLGGQIIDGLILIPIIILLGFVLGFGGFLSDDDFEVGFGVEVLLTLLTAGAFIAINYHFWERNGQSIGKLAVGTKIVRTNGERCPAARIITHRYLPITLAQLIPIIGGVIGLVDALLLFRADKKCLHDDIADTIVIKARPAVPPTPGG